MAERTWRMHTNWTWREGVPNRHIWLYTDGHTWRLMASEDVVNWERIYPEFSAAMTVVQGMLERTGGERKWRRVGPDQTGSRFD